MLWVEQRQFRLIASLVFYTTRLAINLQKEIQFRCFARLVINLMQTQE